MKLKNGTSLVAERVEGHGDSYGWKDKEAVFAKFRSLAGEALAPNQIDAAINAVMDLERSKNVADIVQLLLPAADLKAQAAERPHKATLPVS